MRQVQPTGREDDRCAVLTVQLMRETDADARKLQIDIDQRHVGSVLTRQLERVAGGVCGPEHSMSRVFQHRGGTVRNNHLILDDQHDHHTSLRDHSLLSQGTAAAAGSGRGGVCTIP